MKFVTEEEIQEMERARIEKEKAKERRKRSHQTHWLADLIVSMLLGAASGICGLYVLRGLVRWILWS
jgi:hypothetical protein